MVWIHGTKLILVALTCFYRTDRDNFIDQGSEEGEGKERNEQHFLIKTELGALAHKGTYHFQ